MANLSFLIYTHTEMVKSRGGGTDLEMEHGDVQPWGLPFHAFHVVHKGPISSKRA